MWAAGSASLERVPAFESWQKVRRRAMETAVCGTTGDGDERWRQEVIITPWVSPTRGPSRPPSRPAALTRLIAVVVPPGEHVLGDGLHLGPQAHVTSAAASGRQTAIDAGQRLATRSQKPADESGPEGSGPTTTRPVRTTRAPCAVRVRRRQLPVRLDLAQDGDQVRRCTTHDVRARGGSRRQLHPVGQGHRRARARGDRRPAGRSGQRRQGRAADGPAHQVVDRAVDSRWPDLQTVGVRW